jgi:hypothetical protein
MRQLYGYVMVSVFLGNVLAYTYLCDRLRRFHFGTWMEFGNQEFVHDRFRWSSWQANYLIVPFIFSGRHKDLGDTRLTLLIWLNRAMTGVFVLLFLGLFLLR